MFNSLLILVINLESRKDRLKRMEDRLSGHNFMRVSATTVADLDRAFLNSESKLSPPEIACTKSHINALKVFLDTKYESCIILEDDIILGSYFSKFTSSFHHFPDNTFVVKLETHLNKFCYNKMSSTINGLKFNRIQSFHHGAAAYATSRKGANLIVNELYKLDCPVDDVIFERMVIGKSRGIALQLNPACCIQEKHICEELKIDSDIETDRKIRLEKQKGDTVLEGSISQLNTKVKIKFSKKIIRELIRIVLNLTMCLSFRKKGKIAYKHN